MAVTQHPGWGRRKGEAAAAAQRGGGMTNDE